MIQMPGIKYKGPFLPLKPHEVTIHNNIKNIVYYLAETIGERNYEKKENLNKAVEYITNAFRKSGLTVTEQTYTIDNDIYKNIIGEKMGTQKPEEIIVVGAHYDTVFGSPGADDNASGVACVIEIANLLSNILLPYTIHFVAFVNEEPPFYWSKQMGSWQYAKNAYKNKTIIPAMLSIESIGYYSEERNSQSYPFPLNFFYPDIADFIGFVGNLASRNLVHKTIASFRQHVSFPSEGISAPSWIPGIAWSDQWSFWKHGFPAVMVTGSALFRNPNYHLNTDTPDTLDYKRMARVVYGLSKVVRSLAE